MKPLFHPPHLLDGQRWRGMRVGLLGGSFNPPHVGHIHIASVALRRLGLDCIWWLVTPQNPLKESSGDYGLRLDLCREITRPHPRMIVSDIEAQMGTWRTLDTLTQLRRRFPATDFTFVGGTDLAAQLPRWHRWRELPALVPFAFVARPPALSLVGMPLLRHFGTGERIIWIRDEPLHCESSSRIRKSRQNNPLHPPCRAG